MLVPGSPTATNVAVALVFYILQVRPELRCRIQTSRDQSQVSVMTSRIVELNVGGVLYTTTLATMKSDKDSLLGQWFSSAPPSLSTDSNGRYVIFRTLGDSVVQWFGLVWHVIIEQWLERPISDRKVAGSSTPYQKSTIWFNHGFGVGL